MKRKPVPQTHKNIIWWPELPKYSKGQWCDALFLDKNAICTDFYIFLSKNSYFKYMPFSILNILICHRLIHEPLGGAVTYTDESEWLHENLCFESCKTSHHLSVTSFTLNGCIRLDMFVSLTFCSLQLDARHNRRNPASTAATHRHTSASAWFVLLTLPNSSCPSSWNVSNKVSNEILIETLL